jgi:hypothetical protein
MNGEPTGQPGGNDTEPREDVHHEWQLPTTNVVGLATRSYTVRVNTADLCRPSLRRYHGSPAEQT